MIRTFLIGVLLTYASLTTLYTLALHTGRVASITQACGQHEPQPNLTNADYITQLEHNHTHQ